jgi:predicted nucleic-acid-binding protein
VIGLDTNVLVRYITQDDPVQAARATQVIESLDETRRGFISIVVLIELHWVLRRAYQVSARDAVVVVRMLLNAKELSVQHADAVRRALARSNDDADFSDALIGEFGELAGCDYTATFDERASKMRGMRLL